ncbi:PREDICTED: uncharacterized protein LOC109236265 isoform X2 [Nicotiana attenuata]|uniref:uncharacterized protein LOC109236265 isoform X2 n=1 Tax=Nicotiana attenuata TaxID=49451 RepID=UPI000905340B|nr:PREDICTED: uncharacterized protein LOC109236265 isoform X2 [Nicotiana attenuata]
MQTLAIYTHRGQLYSLTKRIGSQGNYQMGSLQTKDKSNPNAKIIEGLKYKVRLLQTEVSEIMGIREYEPQPYQQEMIIFALKEAEWKQEKKKLKEEVNKLKKKLEEKEEEKFKGVENHEEQVRRDETIEKWKQLYFAIKIELDELIQRTNQGERLYCRTEEVELLEELHGELKAKEEAIAYLKERIASMEKQEVKREREVDILRQSLKIMSYNRKGTILTKGHNKS